MYCFYIGPIHKFVNFYRFYILASKSQTDGLIELKFDSVVSTHILHVWKIKMKIVIFQHLMSKYVKILGKVSHPEQLTTPFGHIVSLYWLK